MRKKYLFMAMIVLVVGMVFGIAGYAIGTSTSSSPTVFSKMWGGEPGDTSGKTALTGGLDSSQHASPEAPAGSSGESGTGEKVSEGNAAGEDEPAKELIDEIVADYKLNVGTFFTAWKAKDMDEFRSKLGEAYSGEILERHAERAEKFITQGVGLNVVDIAFDRVEVIAAEPKAATLTAAYTYWAQDYLVGEEHPIGEVYQHEVNVKVNMVKIGTRWKITGEAPIEVED